MSRRLSLALPLLLLWPGLARPEDDTAALLRDIRAVAGGHTAASPTARKAWDRLVARGPAALPRVLEAMDTPDPVAANWLRTAFDRIADADLRTGGKQIDTDALLAFARDRRRHGRARRLALETADRLRPGSSSRLLAGWLDDPEFRYDAVALLAEEAGALARAGSRDKAAAAYRKAFAATNDVPQGQMLAARLKELGSTVSLAEHFGFLTDWYVIGPFDARGGKGFQTAYPPEREVDLAAELPGKAGKVRWKHYRVAESPAAPPARVALVNLLEPLGHADDAVAYAFTAFTVPEARTAEFRGAADDNFTVWVNGKKAFGFEEYRNGIRLDRHRFRVRLRAGTNTVLVKVCQAPADPLNSDPNWEFLLRVTDPTGQGVPFKHTPPEKRS